MGRDSDDVRIEFTASLSAINIVLVDQRSGFEQQEPCQAEELELDYSDIRFNDVTPTKPVTDKEINSSATQSTSGTGFKKQTDEKPVSDITRKLKRSTSLKYSAHDPSEHHLQTSVFSIPQNQGHQSYFIPTFNRKPLHLELKSLLGANVDTEKGQKRWSQVECNDIDVDKSWFSVML